MSNNQVTYDLHMTFVEDAEKEYLPKLQSVAGDFHCTGFSKINPDPKVRDDLYSGNHKGFTFQGFPEKSLDGLLERARKLPIITAIFVTAVNSAHQNGESKTKTKIRLFSRENGNHLTA